jgi:hypothetical protein
MLSTKDTIHFAILLGILPSLAIKATSNVVSTEAVLDGVPKHLCFYDNSPIHPGDWFLTKGRILKQCKEKNTTVLTDMVDDTYSEHVCKKVVASTDFVLNKVVPRPPQSFIDEYAKVYSSGKIINDVLIEYVKISEPDKKNLIKGWLEKNRVDHSTVHHDDDLVIKVDKDSNTINIKKAKTTWSRKELIDTLEKYVKDTQGENNILDSDWLDQNL